jgi:GTP-binding protein EngB required for normal cell division
MEYLAELNGDVGCKFQMVLNKCDEVSIEELSKRGTLISKQVRQFSSAIDKPIFTSARMTKGLDSFRNILFHLGTEKLDRTVKAELIPQILPNSL